MRTYDDDVRDVLAVQVGDSEAFASILKTYKPNIQRAVKSYEGVIGLDEAYSIAVGALGEWCMQASEQDARYLRRNITFVARHAVDEHLHPEIGRESLRLLRDAARSMRARTGVEGEEPRLAMPQAASAHGVSMGSLLTYHGVTNAVSWEDHIERAVDDENPFQQDVAGGYSTDDVLLKAETEFSNAPKHIEICESTSVRARADLSAVGVAVDALGGRQREVVLLVMEGLTDAEIAERLDMRRQSVTVYKKRAFAKLAAQIEPLLSARPVMN